VGIAAYTPIYVKYSARYFMFNVSGIFNPLMIAVIQRVTEAMVRIEERVTGQIQTGFPMLTSITHSATPSMTIVALE